MPLSHEDIVGVVRICHANRCRVRYGVLGAAVIERAGNSAARPQQYAMATVSLLNKGFGGRCEEASWVVGSSGWPTDYPKLGDELPDPQAFGAGWSLLTRLFGDVPSFLHWLDATRPGWDSDLRSRFP